MRLFKLSRIIRKPAPYDRYKQLASIEPLPFLFDVMHVQDKFPEVRSRPFLAERLGKANSQRRDYFRYRRIHKEKLAKESRTDLHRRPRNRASSVGSSDDEQTRKQSHPSHKQLQSSLGSTKASTFVPPPEGVDLLDVDEASDTGQSETSYATSVNEDDSTTLRVPSIPDTFEEGIGFECPYCYAMQLPKNRRAWKSVILQY